MPVFSDLNSFNPKIRPRIEDVSSIFQSLFNILNTKPGERLFRPDFGIDIEEELFGLIDDISAVAVLSRITNTIEVFEDRIEIDFENTQVTPNPEENRYDVDLVFTIPSIEGETKFQFSGQLGRSA